MINLTRLLKVAVAWTSIAYTACYLVVWLVPQSRDLFMTAALHASVPVTSGPFTVGTFVAGLVIWNIVAVFAVGLFAYLYNTIRS